MVKTNWKEILPSCCSYIHPTAMSYPIVTENSKGLSKLNVNVKCLVVIMEYGSTPYVGMAWEKNGVHI